LKFSGHEVAPQITALHSRRLTNDAAFRSDSSVLWRSLQRRANERPVAFETSPQRHWEKKKKSPEKNCSNGALIHRHVEYYCHYHLNFEAGKRPWWLKWLRRWFMTLVTNLDTIWLFLENELC